MLDARGPRRSCWFKRSSEKLVPQVKPDFQMLPEPDVQPVLLHVLHESREHLIGVIVDQVRRHDDLLHEADELDLVQRGLGLEEDADGVDLALGGVGGFNT